MHQGMLFPLLPAKLFTCRRCPVAFSPLAPTSAPPSLLALSLRPSVTPLPARFPKERAASLRLPEAASPMPCPCCHPQISCLERCASSLPQHFRAGIGEGEQPFLGTGFSQPRSHLARSGRLAGISQGESLGASSSRDVRRQNVSSCVSPLVHAGRLRGEKCHFPARGGLAGGWETGGSWCKVWRRGLQCSVPHESPLSQRVWG